MKADTFSAGPPQRRQAMADLLEAGAEAMTEHLDVISLRSCRFEKRLIGHENRSGEIVRERDPGHALGFARDIRFAGDAIEHCPLREQAELVGDLKIPAAATECLRQREHSALGIETPQRPPHRADSFNADLDTLDVLKVADEAVIDVRERQAGAPPERLGAVFELGEVIPMMLNEIVDFFGGRTRPINPRDFVAFRQLHGQRVGRFLSRTVRVIERQDGARHGRRLHDEVAHVCRGDVVAVEHRIAERFEQICGKASIRIGRERLQVELENLGQLDQM
jgi:hypothetical protein